MILQATVRTPWGDRGDEFEVKEPTVVQKRYIESGVLIVVKSDPPPKKKAEADGKNQGDG